MKPIALAFVREAGAWVLLLTGVAFLVLLIPMLAVKVDVSIQPPHAPMAVATSLPLSLTAPVPLRLAETNTVDLPSEIDVPGQFAQDQDARAQEKVSRK